MSSDINTRKKRILDFMHDPVYIPMREKDLAVMMDVSSDDRALFKQCLNELLEDDLITVNKRGKYRLMQKQVYEGIFNASGRGFGFVSVDGFAEDFFVSEKNTNTALNGDRVMIEVIPKSYKRTGTRSHTEAVVNDVLERWEGCVVGTFETSKGNYGFVVPDSSKFSRDIFIPASEAENLEDGQKVVVKITKFGSAKESPEGEIVEVLGRSGDPGVDILAIIRAYGLDTKFPEPVRRESRSIKKKILKDDRRGRLDIQDLDMVTIDKEDSKDLDDAVSLTPKGEMYELGVHIADVSHYVAEDSEIDKEARARGTSCYPVDRVIPMLPQVLSNGICSLNEQEERLAVSCFMTISKKGEIKDYRFALTVIRTNHRMTYDEVDKIITGHDADMIAKYADVAQMLLEMNDVAMALRHRRKSRGSIDFDLAETSIKLDSKGHPIEICASSRSNATMLIEDFMLAANETVAQHFFWSELPFVYRVHENPDSDKIRKLATLIRNFGYGIKVKNDEIHPKELQKLLASTEGRPEESLISHITLRSMQRARYSPECTGHFGLALQYYCHFTSPIRRYPDLQIHRIIKDYLTDNLDQDRIAHYREILDDVCKTSSRRERIANEIEREAEKLKKAEYMADHIGEEFEGIISSVTNFGIYVELENTVEGLVHVSKIEGDSYIYNDDRYELEGSATGRRFSLGMKVKVICNMVDIGAHTVDFVLAG